MSALQDLTLATTVHDNADMSAAMLQSFCQHAGAPHEIVVVDDGSTPKYRPNESLCAPVRVVRHQTARGFCKASDAALRSVRTPYALLVDADVLFQPGDFAGGFAEFQQSNWAWVNFRQISFDGVPQDAFEEPLMPPWVFAGGNQLLSLWQQRHRARRMARANERIMAVDAAHSSCALVNMSAFSAIGGFDSWYAQCESDIEICLRFRKHGYGVGVDTGYEVKHAGAGGRSGSIERVIDLYRARLHLYEKEYPMSRFYLRPILFLRHALELGWFGGRRLFGKQDARLASRVRMLKGVWRGYT